MVYIMKIHDHDHCYCHVTSDTREHYKYSIRSIYLMDLIDDAIHLKYGTEVMLAAIVL